MNVFSKNKDLKLIDHINKKSLIIRLPQFLIGCLIISLAYNIFIAPNELVPGGVGGIAIIVNSIFGISTSTFIIVVDILLLVLSYFLLERSKTKAAILGSILFPTFIKLTENVNTWLQIDTTDLLLSTLFGGILFGFGMGLVFKAGFSSGGTDILNQINSKYFKISLGRSMIFTDGTIVLSSMFFFGITHMMYSILLLYIISLIADRVVLGISDSKAFFIITNKEIEVKEYIIKHLGHGVTVFKAKGGYKRHDEDVLMAVLPTRDYYKLREGIKEIDENAFFIITDTYEVFGGE